MNFFEKQFRRMLWGDNAIIAPFYVDGVCFGTLGRDYLIQMEFTDPQEKYRFDTLEIVAAHRRSDELNTIHIQLEDVLGKKFIFPAKEGSGSSHMWVNRDLPGWNSYQLTQGDWDRLYDAVKGSLDSLRKPENHSSPNPRLVYICAPLRGNVKRNIEFARRRAREVFQTGEVPICPHLMFPPIADPGNPPEDQAARDMGLRLMALCQQVNVYGGECTAGMQTEIHLARELGIPVKFMEGGDGHEEK